METFVVRVFVPAEHETVPFTGTVEHVGAGRATSFQGGAELLDVVLRELRANRVKEVQAQAHTAPMMRRPDPEEDA